LTDFAISLTYIFDLSSRYEWTFRKITRGFGDSKNY